MVLPLPVKDYEDKVTRAEYPTYQAARDVGPDRAGFWADFEFG